MPFSIDTVYDAFVTAVSGADALWILRAACFVTIFAAFIGAVWHRNLLLKVLAMDIMSTGVISLYVLTASETGRTTPTVVNSADVAYADPLPQAVILTEIVIGFSILALLLVGLMVLSKRYPSLDTDEIEGEF